MSTADDEAQIIAALASSPTQMPAVLLALISNLLASRLGATDLPPEVQMRMKAVWGRIRDDIMETRKAREIVEQGMDS